MVIRPQMAVGPDSAGQVLIDLQAIKACLLKFPQGMDGSALSASSVRICRDTLKSWLTHLQIRAQCDQEHYSAGDADESD